MFVGRVGRPAKPQAASLALQDFDDDLLSPNEFYNTGGSAIGADARLAVPAMVQNAPDVTKFGPNVEESLFGHAPDLVRKRNKLYDSEVLELGVENSKAVRMDSHPDYALAKRLRSGVTA